MSKRPQNLSILLFSGPPHICFFRFDTKMNASLIARRTPLTEVNSQLGSGAPTLERKDSHKDAAGAPSDCYLSELHNSLASWWRASLGRREVLSLRMNVRILREGFK